MNSFVKAIKCAVSFISVLMIMLAVIFVLQNINENPGNAKCLAMDGYSEKIGIRGFDLPSEQEQPILVSAVEIKEQRQIDIRQIDIRQIVFIGLIVVGVLASVIILGYWYKTAKRGD
jgi:hypothetical protein